MAKHIDPKEVYKPKEEEPSKNERVMNVAAQTGRAAMSSKRPPMYKGPQGTAGNKRVPLKRNY